jgi:hypothetical protein
MRRSTGCAFNANPVALNSEEHDLLTLRMRVAAEYREMPGLMLTVAQAARLFSIDLARCERVLTMLVERGVLATDGHAFAQADAGARWA